MDTQSTDTDETPLVGVIGTTASGKTALGVELAERLEAAEGVCGEVVSLDSMLVYRGLDIGTAKPTEAEQRGVLHHAIDVVEPETAFDVKAYVDVHRRAEAVARGRGATPLVVGGTAFYLQALVFGLPDQPPVDAALRAELLAAYDADGPERTHARLQEVDPELAARLHPNDKKRVVRGLEVHAQTGEPASAREVRWDPAAVRRPVRLALLEPDPDELDARILARTRAMFAAGWLEEAAEVEPRLGPTARGVLGYREAAAAFHGEVDEGQAIERIAQLTRQFARRQRTWLRRFAKLGLVRAFDAPRTQEDLERIAPEVLAYWSS